MSRLISSNELHNAAKTEYLNGRDPATPHDWELCVNYWAANIASGLEESACVLLSKLFECPLLERDIKKIAAFQAERKH